ncbi:hypothetical protein B9Z55_000642 [Caenorhabditis nigoni]|uniref:Methyltransferase FkbM domain-containing protein n=1 Tax=Caenorhabditis nigoni TaxID=1611254 RepID=A0A2G5VU51_9PELO|nr:hypothetical protein B9Z55_000642 [Caenorhabditis nigoni]
MARSSLFSLFFVAFSSVLAVYFLIQISPDPRISSNLKRKILENWSICAREQLDKIHTADEFWHQFPSLTSYCDLAENIDLLGLISLKNSDEVKYALMPKNVPAKNSTFNFVTLGIGKDITAEKAFKEEANFLGYEVKFYGADPIIEDNSQLFSQIGEFFPFAIGGKTEISNASVLKNGTYREETISHVELLKFLKDNLKITEIDHLWLDAEGAEFGLFDYFYNDGPLERNGISFCQMNLEVHIGDINRKIEFMKFAKRLAHEKRFVMLKSVYVSHIRLYLFNFGSSKCVDKYL